jgi:hypothetical protein
MLRTHFLVTPRRKRRAPLRTFTGGTPSVAGRVAAGRSPGAAAVPASATVRMTVKPTTSLATREITANASLMAGRSSQRSSAGAWTHVDDPSTDRSCNEQFPVFTEMIRGQHVRVE